MSRQPVLTRSIASGAVRRTTARNRSAISRIGSGYMERSASGGIESCVGIDRMVPHRA